MRAGTVIVMMVALLVSSPASAGRSTARFGDFEMGMRQREVAQLFRTWEREGNLVDPVRDPFIPGESGIAQFLPNRAPYKGIAALVLSFEGSWDTPQSIKEMEDRNPDARLNEIYINLAATKTPADHEAFFSVMKRLYGTPKRGEDSKNLRIGGSLTLSDGRIREYRIVRRRNMEWLIPYGTKGRMYQIIANLEYLDNGSALPRVVIFHSSEVTDEAWKPLRKMIKIPDNVLSRWSISTEGGHGLWFSLTSKDDKETAPVRLERMYKENWGSLDYFDGRRLIDQKDRSTEAFRRMRIGNDQGLWHYVRITEDHRRKPGPSAVFKDGNVNEMVYIETPEEIFRLSTYYESTDDTEVRRRGLWSLVRSWGK